MYHTFIMKSLENNKNCKKKKRYLREWQLSHQWKLLNYFYHMGVFSSKKKVAIYLSFFNLMYRSLKILHKQIFYVTVLPSSETAIVESFSSISIFTVIHFHNTYWHWCVIHLRTDLHPEACQLTEGRVRGLTSTLPPLCSVPRAGSGTR